MTQQLVGSGTTGEFKAVVDANFDELYAFREPNMLRTGIATNTQLIPVKTWTPVLWRVIDSNSTAMTLDADDARWFRPGDDARGIGLFDSVAYVAWENTNPALVAPHRRAMAFVQYGLGDLYQFQWFQEETLFIPGMGDTSIPSVQQVYMQDGYPAPNPTSMILRFDVWHNAEVPINIVGAGSLAPILRSKKVSN